MAERKVDGKDILLMLDVDFVSGTPAYELIVCLLDNSFSRTRDEIDASSKCGPDNSTGTLKVGPIEFSGQIVYSPTTGRAGIAALDAAIRADKLIPFKYGKATPDVTGDVVYTGFGKLTNLEETAGLDDKAQFSASLTVIGDYTTTVTA